MHSLQHEKTRPEFAKVGLVVHRHPHDGAYHSVQFFSETEVLSLEGRTEIISVAELLPPTAPDTAQ